MDIELMKNKSPEEVLKTILDENPNAIQDFLKNHCEFSPLIAFMMIDTMKKKEEK